MAVCGRKQLLENCRVTPKGNGFKTALRHLWSEVMASCSFEYIRTIVFTRQLDVVKLLKWPVKNNNFVILECEEQSNENVLFNVEITGHCGLLGMGCVMNILLKFCVS